MNLDEFSRALSSMPDQDLVAAKPYFDQLVSGLDIEALLLSELEKCARDSRHPPNTRSGSSIILHEGNWFTLEYMTLENSRHPEIVCTESTDAIYHFLTGAHILQYSLENFANKICNSEARAICKGETEIPPQTTLLVRSESELVSMRSPDPIRMLVLSKNIKNIFSWDFYSKGGAPISHYNNRPLVSLLELMAKLMGLYGDRESTEPLAKLLEHESPTVRWEAVTGLVKVDLPRGILELERLAQSNDVSLAPAARQTLAANREMMQWQ